MNTTEASPFRRSRTIVPLIALLFALIATNAQAHSAAATATCNSVTITWTSFAASGSGNGGLNTPPWSVTYKPVSGATTTLSGRVSFSGASKALTVAIPSGNGTVAVSSSWSSANTRDGNADSMAQNLTIANCPATPPSPAPVPAPALIAAAPASPAPPVSLRLPTLSTTASAPVALGRAISDTAVLGNANAPTGTITFTLYAGADTACASPLGSVSTVVNGNGTYKSPTITPTKIGPYQWVAAYSGDASNSPISGSCNDPKERTTVNTKLVKGECVSSPIKLRGIAETVRTSQKAYVAATGVKRVTFYLDGRKLVTLSKPTNKRFSVSIDARKLGYGRHTVKATATLHDANCAPARVAGAFIRVRPALVRPEFTG